MFIVETLYNKAEAVMSHVFHLLLCIISIFILWCVRIGFDACQILEELLL
jgi:hypothetical protein